MTMIIKKYECEDGETITEYTSAYIPKKSDAQKAMLWLSAMKAHLVHFSKKDEGSTGLRAYILSYKGNGKRRALQGISYCRVDIGKVGAKFMDVWPRRTLMEIGAPNKQIAPIRVMVDGDKVYKVI